jgi:hypothetical protein
MMSPEILCPRDKTGQSFGFVLFCVASGSALIQTIYICICIKK